MGKFKSIDIFLVEDNPGDARLAQEALKESKMKNHLHIVNDGMAATDFLFKRNDYKDAPRPDLIILDLNLPKKHGHEVLGYSGDADPPCPVMLTPHKDYGSKNLND